MLCIGDVVKTNLSGDSNPFAYPPVLPADVFAIAAQLLELSGAYHHLWPTAEDRNGLASDQRTPRRLIVDEAMRKRAISVGRKWNRDAKKQGDIPDPPGRVCELWAAITKDCRHPVYEPLDPAKPCPEWWVTALELLIIADEASDGLGFDDSIAFVRPFRQAQKETAEQLQLSHRESSAKLPKGLFSYATVDNTVACVAPKSRTPGVGCTMRSLSHNLALLPSTGLVRARWLGTPAQRQQEPQDALNLLLIPFPYHIERSAFIIDPGPARERWRWFSIDPLWLPDDEKKHKVFIEFVVGLIENAQDNVGRIDGVIFPELALNREIFLALAIKLREFTDVDFLISGLSQDLAGQFGNHVAIVPYFLMPDRSDSKQVVDHILLRQKHHRWKITESQIKDYDLNPLPSGIKSLWEKIDITSRSFDILVHRGASTITTLICEDLARIDPCQTVLRAIGPNLVIALLMDGPQLPERWSARYATVLADDPGSSVLTLTSYGLISRQNRARSFPQQSSIGLWKDETGHAQRIELARDAWAVCLTLQSEKRTEFTLDGRCDDGVSHVWKLKGQHFVHTRGRSAHSWLTSGIARGEFG